MSRPRVKICGLTRTEDADLAVALGADAVGFVLWSESPRVVSAGHAAIIARSLPAFVTRVGVFVNASPEDVRRLVAEVGLDVAQLHGDERVADYAGVAGRIIKVAALGGDADVDSAIRLPAEVTVLVDVVDRERRGGTGARADWARAARVARERPVILAGGLTAADVGEAIRRVRPWAVDVSSGVEDRPGIKSAEKLRALFAAVAASAATTLRPVGPTGKEDV
jgi:phosphoribosylanthranilate isomerase